jgi:hypothetical protein
MFADHVIDAALRGYAYSGLPRPSTSRWEGGIVNRADEVIQ